MKDNESIIYRLLTDVFQDAAYSGITLNETLKTVDDFASRAYITKVFYGVIEKSIQFDYIIGLLSEKKPKNNITILIKMGLYLLRYTAVPSHASVSKIVDLTKKLGKSGAAGFVNAILRKSQSVDIDSLQFASELQRLSVVYSYPLWAADLLVSQLGKEDAEAFLAVEKREKTHIRHNGFVVSRQDFEARLAEICKGKESMCLSSGLGYYVTHEVMKALPPNYFTAQSFSSMLAVRSYLTSEDISKYKIRNALDVCGAPGGKAVYLKELYTDLEITVCDIHPHRLSLVSDYAQRMGASLVLQQNDGTIPREEWTEKFDLVICDVPCSGLGLVNSKPDIILNRKATDIAELVELQQKILAVSARYLKKGGILCYSTCTIAREENDNIIDGFLSKNPSFSLLPIQNGIADSQTTLQLLPHVHGCDGFFIAKLRKL